LQSDTIDLLAQALIAFQGEMPSVGKTADNPFFKSKYADLASIVKEAGPILNKNGLAVSQLPTHLVIKDSDVVPALKTTVLHSSGQWLSEVTPLLLVKQDSQSQGSATTYLRRYAYQAALGIVADIDDDGNAASAPAAPASSPRAATNTPAPAGLKDKVAARAGRPVATATAGEPKATDNQTKKIYAIQMAMGWEKQDILNHIELTIGVKVASDRDLTKLQATEYIGHLEAEQEAWKKGETTISQEADSVEDAGYGYDEEPF
jgi:hypothetical protein